MKAVLFDGAIPRYVLTRAAGALSRRALIGPLRCTRFVEIEAPTLPGNRWVRVATRLGGICGSDVSLVRLNVSPSTSPFSSFPFVVGHENVGTVVETGAAVTRVRKGDRVVANPLLACRVRGIDPVCPHCADDYPSRCERFTDGSIAPGMMIGTTRGLGGSWGELYVAHEDQLARVADGVPDRLALLTEPFACAVSPVLAYAPAPGSRVLVIGAGSVGLLTLAALRMFSQAEVTVLARHRFQAEHAERIGARRVVMERNGDYFAELSRIVNGRLMQPILGKRIHVGGFDASFVCVGNETAVEDALRFTRSGGMVVMLGNVARLRRVDWTPVWIKELSIHGSLCYHHVGHAGARQDAFLAAAGALASERGRVLEALVTHVVPLAQFDHALAIAMGRRGSGAVKVALAGAGGASGTGVGA